MIITRLKEKDLSSLAKLFKQFWGEASQIEKMRSSYQKISDNSAYILLAAKQGDDLVGFGMGIICEELYGDCKPFMVVEDLIVDKNQRRSGIGSELIRELEKQAIANNCCQIIFVTETDRSDAHRFYESLGYKSEPYKGFKKKIESGQQLNSADAKELAAD
jgi:GNAT superfamily N-acetyltransferase